MIQKTLRILVSSPLLVALLVAVIGVLGWRAFLDNPKDAIPDIAENQTIVLAEWPGRSPRDVDEQITYPLTVALQGVPGVREIRGTSGFGWAIVYVVFSDDVEFYWARSRVLERLEGARAKLPAGVTPVLGPDATSLGQVLWYTIDNGWYSPRYPGLRFEADGTLSPASRAAVLARDPSREEALSSSAPYTCPLSGVPLAHSQLPLDELRSIQDFQVKLALESVDGVSEVASVGGYVRQYQVDVDPEALTAYGLQLDRLVNAVRSSNLDVGAKVVEQSGMEVLVRGVGFAGGDRRSLGSREEREAAVIRDLESIVVGARDGTPILIRHVADVRTGPDFRRGALDKEGAEAVGACVVMRYGENPLTVLDGVKEEIGRLEESLPPGLRIVAFYDRTELIEETMDTLGSALWQALAITIAAVMLFLLHLRAGLAIGITLPLAALFAFIGMELLGIGSNIMSLAGIAIAIGIMDDMAIVMTENIYQHLSDRRSEYLRVVTDPDLGERRIIDRTRRNQVVLEGAHEVTGAILTAVATTVISFLPVFFLTGEAGRLFSPLAWTKTLCLVGAAMMAVLVIPPLVAVALVESQVPLRRRPLVASIVGASTAIAWLAASWIGLIPEGLQTPFGIPSLLFAPLVGVGAGLLTWLLMRERIRPIDESPVSRVIARAYEPSLRWVLAHPWLFLALPATITLVGFSIWLGAARIAGPVLDGLALVGLDVTHWSLAWWVHLILGLVCGFALAPLLADTARAAGLLRRPHLRRSVRLGMGAAIALLVALTLHGVRFASRNADAVWAVFGARGAGVERDPARFMPVAEWRQRPGGIGEEFMPPLDEGDFLYMPSLLPAASINTAMEVMQKQDIQFAQIPEVEVVVGKLGRIDSALDPAPLGMLETVIGLKPRSEWPEVEDGSRVRRRSQSEVWEEIRQAGSFPGVLPSVRLQPIRTRVEMLSTGLNAPIGLKVYGDSVESTEALAVDIEHLLRARLTDAETVNALRTNRKPYLEIHIDRQAIARYGVELGTVQQAIEVAIGGINLSTAFEGLDRYPIRLRYARELRDDVSDLEQVLIPTPAGSPVPLGQLAAIREVVGPMSIRREGAKYVSYVILGSSGVDEATLVGSGQDVLREAIIDGHLTMPPGAHVRWTGTYERHLETRQRLLLIVPGVLLINFVLIYVHFRRLVLSLVVFLAIPVSFAGGFILLRLWPGIHDFLYTVGLLGQGFEGDAMYLTVAVWVGFIALFGIAIDDGIVMGTYLRQTFAARPVVDIQDIRERVVTAGLRRIRPCLMTTATTLAALVPVLATTGRGSEVMAPMAVPVFGGMLASLISLFVVPCCYFLAKQTAWRFGLRDPDFVEEVPAVATSS